MCGKRPFVTILTALIIGVTTGAQAPETVSLRERLFIASRVYHLVSTYFPNLSQKEFDEKYTQSLDLLLKSPGDRRDFDLTMMEFVANLHDAHTWFYDEWLDRNYGQPVGFSAYRMEGVWVVVQSYVDAIKIGDVIEAIDGVPMEDFFSQKLKYISASSDRDAQVSFFGNPVLFPEQFTVTLRGTRKATLDRREIQKIPPPVLKTEGRWVVPHSVAYIKVPSFHGSGFQMQALELLRQFHDSKTLILDVRDNQGGGMGSELQAALMDKDYLSWTMSSPLKGGLLRRPNGLQSSDVMHSDLAVGNALIRPPESSFKGRLIVLIDRGCTCACEDLVIPLKLSGRAKLIGETTAVPP